MVRIRRRLLVVLLALLAATPGAAPAAAEDGTLYLEAPRRDGDVANFTTYAATDATGTLVDPLGRDATTTEWRWMTTGTPAAWTLEAGAPVVARLWIENLDQALPATEVPEDAAALGAVRVTVGLFHIDNVPFASGTVYHRPPAGGRAGAVAVAVPIDVPTRSTFEASRGGVFGVHVVVAAQTTAETALGIWVGGSDRDAHVVLPGYPVAAFRAWEDAVTREEDCRIALQRQTPCATGPPEEDEAEVAPAGGVGILAALAVLVRRRRRATSPDTTTSG